MIMNFGSRITDRKLANFKRLASESENWLSFVVTLLLGCPLLLESGCRLLLESPNAALSA